jgi:hypothetical protein
LQQLELYHAEVKQPDKNKKPRRSIAKLSILPQVSAKVSYILLNLREDILKLYSCSAPAADRSSGP